MDKFVYQEISVTYQETYEVEGLKVYITENTGGIGVNLDIVVTRPATLTYVCSKPIDLATGTYNQEPVEVTSGMLLNPGGQYDLAIGAGSAAPGDSIEFTITRWDDVQLVYTKLYYDNLQAKEEDRSSFPVVKQFAASNHAFIPITGIYITGGLIDLLPLTYQEPALSLINELLRLASTDAEVDLQDKWLKSEPVNLETDELFAVVALVKQW